MWVWFFHEVLKCVVFHEELVEMLDEACYFGSLKFHSNDVTQASSVQPL